jgi:hypothetical protein
MSAVYPSTLTTTTLLVNTLTTSKIIYLPAVSTISTGKLFYIKDMCGNAARSSIFLCTTGLDTLDKRLSTSFGYMSTNWGSLLLGADGGTNWIVLQNYTRSLVSSPINPINVAPAIVTALGATSYLPLGTGSTDRGTTPQTITTNGTVTYGLIAGKAGAYFNNSIANYLSLPYTNQTNFTVCFWMYPMDATYYTAFSITNVSYAPAMQVDTAFQLALTVLTAMPNMWTDFQTVPYGGPTVWSFVTITLNQTTFVEQVYVNAVLQNTATGTATGVSSMTLFILGKSGDNSRGYNGYLRQFAYFPTVLTGAQISQLYLATA